MEFIKKNIKMIIGFIAGVILASGITVYATYTYLATDVSYERNGTEISVANALNDLYDNKQDVSELNSLRTSINQSDATESDILSGKKAYTTNGLITGTYTPLTTTKGIEYNYGEFKFAKNGQWSVINCGFKPTKLCLWLNTNDGGTVIYDGNDWWWTSYGSYKILNNGQGNDLTDNGFKLQNWDDSLQGVTITWFAIK